MYRMCLLLALAGCGAKAAPKSVVPPAFRGSSSALGEAPAVAFLHRDTTFILVAANPAALDRATGWMALLRGQRADLPDLAELASAGVALDKPAGLALVDPRHDTWVAFATVADPDRLTDWIATRARGDGGAVRPSRAGEATVFLPGDDAGRAAVLRGDQILFLRTDGGTSTRDLAAVRLAALEAADSVVETDDYRNLERALDFGRDAAVYVSASWLAAGGGADVERALVLEERVAAALGAAREQNDPATAAALERQLAMVRQIAAAAARAERYRLEVGGQLGPIAIGFELTGDQLRVAAVARPAIDSAVARLLPGTRAPHPLAGAITRPAFVASAHFDPEALRELVGGWLASRGSSLDRLREAARGIGVDLDGGLLHNLTGELLFAVAGGPNRALDVTAAAGVSDPARARTLVARLGASAAAAPDGEAAIVDAGLGAPLRLAEVGGRLVASTQPALTRPLDDGAAADTLAAARLILAGWMMLGGNAPDVPPPRLIALRPDDHPAELSTAYLGLRGKLDAERARLDELRHEHDIATATHRRNLGVIVGHLELTIERDGPLYRGFGRLVSPAGTVTATARDLSDAARREAADDERRTAELADRQSDIDALERELERLRRADIDAFEKSRPPR